MLLTTGAEYGVKTVLCMCTRENDAAVPLKVIAHECHLPENYLSKILQRLVAARILRSSKGMHRGFSLAKHPSLISVLEVIQAVEGPIEIYTCVLSPEVCEKSSVCPVRKLMAKAHSVVQSMFSSKNFEDLAKESGACSLNEKNKDDAMICCI